MKAQIATSIALSLFASSALASTTDFSSGNNGWGVFFDNDGTLGDFIRPDGGNPGEHLQFTMIETFGVSLRNDSNAEVIGDYSRFSAGVNVSVDVKVESIFYPFGAGEVPRNLVAEFLDYNPDGSDYPWTSVWYDLGEISSAQPGWRTLSVNIDNPSSATLPAGWGGYGAEDPVTFEPELPADRTFASVLASVDEIRFTTYVPGYFYGFTNFDLRFDNITVAPGPVPEPTTLAGLAGLMTLARRRR
jgi:hypothetical protein